MIDTFRLNALVAELVAPGDTFNPLTAVALREALPEEFQSPVSVRGAYTSDRSAGTGMTNAGPVQIEDEKERQFSLGASRGTYVGRYRVIRHRRDVLIEPRNLDTSAEIGTCYRLRFMFGHITFKVSKVRELNVWLPFCGHIAFGVMTWVPFKFPERTA